MNSLACQHSERRPLNGSRVWHQCCACGIWLRDPMPSQEELDAFYASIYGSGSFRCSASMHATGAVLARQYLGLVERAIPSIDWKNSRILEYGAGEGEVAMELARRGADVVAVEPYGLEACKAKGLTVFRHLEELPRATQFDGIIMTEVIEHMRSPAETFRHLHAALKKDGWLFVTTPNNRSAKARLLKGRWSECAKPGHLFLFCRRALITAFKKAGFQKAVPVRGTVRFSERPSLFLPQQLLRILRLDGQLRYIALKA